MNSENPNFSSNVLLEAKQFSFGYQSTLISPMDFSLHAGEVVSLLGPNGCGKSTFLKTCVGEVKPLGGALLLKNKSIASIKPKELSKIIARVRATLPFSERILVREFVSLGRSAFSGIFDKHSESDETAILNALTQTNTLSFATRPLGALSDGERARVFLAEALARETPILLLDEPTAFLDVPHTISLFKMLKDIALKRRCGILICTHQTSYAETFSDRLLIFNPSSKQKANSGISPGTFFCGTTADAHAVDALAWTKIFEEPKNI